MGKEITGQRGYYAVIPSHVRYDENLTPNAKLLYGEITALTNERGYCWASNAYFADLYKVSKISISNWVKQLADRGYITTEMHYREGTKEIESRHIRIVDYPIKENFNTPQSKLIDPIKENFKTSQSKLTDPIKENFKDNTTINNTFNNTTNNNNLTNINQQENKLTDDVDAGAIDVVIDFYQQNIGVVNPYTSQELLAWKKDLSEELVLEALKRSISANNPMNYAKSIMKNWANKNIKTLADVEADEVAYKRAYGFENNNSNAIEFDDDWNYKEL